LHRAVLIILYSIGLVFVVMVFVKGFSYYFAPEDIRPHLELHRELRPSGRWGHGLGIAGSTMMLLLFLYSARKKQFCGLRFGKIRYWLNIHIFFGIMGPLLVTLHTSFKFGGIVMVSYCSMVAVMLSGFIGRYLYVQIPRALSGDELTLKQMTEMRGSLERLLVDEFHLSEQTMAEVRMLSQIAEAPKFNLALMFLILRNDLSRPYKMWRLKRELRAEQRLPAQHVEHLLKIIKQQSLLVRKMSLLSVIKPLFHYWHVAHKPFAHVMIVVMFIHIIVTMLFGYRWIF